MTKVKFYYNQLISELEKNINEFLKSEEVKQLIDIKFTASSKNDTDRCAYVIIYEENVHTGKEDPQIYEYDFSSL
jgi:hypothetical protein